MPETPLQEITFTILGNPQSKSNSRRLVRFKGRMLVIKSAAALTYLHDFQRQCPTLDRLLEGDLCTDIVVWYKSARSDLDESLILDAMQGRLYENDRQIKEKHVWGHIDRANPRATITVRVIQDRAGAADSGPKRPRRRGSKAPRAKRGVG